MTAKITPPPLIEPGRVIQNTADSDFGYIREFMGNRFVYFVVSPRAGGLCLGINMNPDKHCNFDCGYCEVDRSIPGLHASLDVSLVAEEIDRMLNMAFSGELGNFFPYRNIPEDLMRLHHVLLSGDGEPTLCPEFLEILQSVIHIRARGKFPFFKIVLITNATGLDLRQVQDGLKLFTPRDEIWAKLEAGSQHYLEEVNRADCLLDKILENILLVARQRPVIIQSLFSLNNHAEPPMEEIDLFARRLGDLKRAGAQIPLVQIYSATRPGVNSTCGHLPLKTLTNIARHVHTVSGLKTRVF